MRISLLNGPLVTMNPETERRTPIIIEALKWKVPRAVPTKGIRINTSDEVLVSGKVVCSSSGSNPSGKRTARRTEPLRWTDTLRPDLQFYAFVPDSAESIGKRELQVSITTKAESKIAKDDDEREADQQERYRKKSSIQTRGSGKRHSHQEHHQDQTAAGARSSRNRDFLENLAHDGDDFRSLDFEFRTQYHAVFQDRLNQDAHIVRRDKIPTVQCGMGAAGQKQRLSGPRTGSDQDAVMFPGLADDIHQVG